MDAKEWLNKGNEFAKRGNYPKAIEAYDKAVEIDPQNAKAWYNKGVALGELERHQEALEAYDKAIEIDHRDVAQPGMAKALPLVSLRDIRKQ